MDSRDKILFLARDLVDEEKNTLAWCGDDLKEVLVAKAIAFNIVCRREF